MKHADHHHQGLLLVLLQPHFLRQQLVKQLAFVLACCIFLSLHITALRYRFLTADEIKKTAHCVWCCPWRRVLPASSRYGVQRGVPLGGIKSLPSFSTTLLFSSLFPSLQPPASLSSAPLPVRQSKNINSSQLEMMRMLLVSKNAVCKLKMQQRSQVRITQEVKG